MMQMKRWPGLHRMESGGAFIPLWNCDTGTSILGATSVPVNAQGVLPKP
jgi:hypothetical protein